MPDVRHSDEYTPATLNTEPLTGQLVTLFKERFGEDRVVRKLPTMGGEDFGRYRTGGDKPIQSIIFWLGAVPQDKWDAAKGDIMSLPSLHSPLWAPDPEPTLMTGVEAMTAAALDLLKK